MYLLNVRSVQLESFPDYHNTRYAILSHRWQDDEVLLQDIESGQAASKAGYTKLNKFCEKAREAGFQYVWCDTYCIDKKSSALLSEAINSMFRWYRESAICYAYLFDVDLDDFNKDVEVLGQSQWFTRGWCLQELLAPRSITFYDRNWQYMGTKKSLSDLLSKITGIHLRAIEGGDLEEFSVAQRMCWASKRVTLRVEDIAYCLMGIFGVNMPLLYGEGERAFVRLQEEIIRRSNDQSIFAHSSPGEAQRLLAMSPADFRASGHIVRSGNRLTGEPYSLTNMGLSAEFVLYPWALDTYLALLDCLSVETDSRRIAIYVTLQPQITVEDATPHAVRVKVDGRPWNSDLQVLDLPSIKRRLYVEGQISRMFSFPPKRYGYWIRDFEWENDWTRDGRLRVISWNDWDPEERIVEMPHGTFATVGIVIWEDGKYSVELRLAFSENFQPIIGFGDCGALPEGTRLETIDETVILKDMQWIKDTKNDNSLVFCSSSRDFPLRETRRWGATGGVHVYCEKIKVEGDEIWAIDVLWRRGVEGLPIDSLALARIMCDGCKNVSPPQNSSRKQD